MVGGSHVVKPTFSRSKTVAKPRLDDYPQVVSAALVNVRS